MILSLFRTGLVIAAFAFLAGYAIDREVRSFVPFIETRERARIDALLRGILFSRSVDVRYFPSGIYTWAASGFKRPADLEPLDVLSDAGEGAIPEDAVPEDTAEIASPDVAVEALSRRLRDRFDKLPFPERGKAVKFLIRGDVHLDMSTQDLIAGGSAADEKQMISDRILTEFNQNPVIDAREGREGDEDRREVARAVLLALSERVRFQDEPVAVFGDREILAVPLEAGSGGYTGEVRARILGFEGERAGLFVRTIDGEPVPAGLRELSIRGRTAEVPLVLDLVRPARLVVVRRAMVGDSVVGSAVVGSVRGYSAPIELAVGIDNEARITGISILSEAETPGLGSRIREHQPGDAVPWFARRFESLWLKDLYLQRNGGQIQSIARATVTSRAVADGVRELVRIKKAVDSGGEQARPE